MDAILLSLTLQKRTSWKFLFSSLYTFTSYFCTIYQKFGDVVCNFNLICGVGVNSMFSLFWIVHDLSWLETLLEKQQRTLCYYYYLYNPYYQYGQSMLHIHTNLWQMKFILYGDSLYFSNMTWLISIFLKRDGGQCSTTKYSRPSWI